MRVAIISDIHGNLPALEATLKEVDDLKADVLYCLGDTVGYGPFPNECLDIVRERCSIVLKGNHDSGLIGETSLDDFNQHGLKAILWSQPRVRKDNWDYIRTLPFSAVDNNLTLAHSSPHRPNAWTYILTLRAAQENFAAFSTELCFIGHTHVPVIIGEDSSINKFRKDCRFIINVGSVGQPRDGNSEAAFGMFDTEMKSYSLIRVPYDVEKTAKAIREAGLPEFLARRLFQGV
jgi:predicted phosphodiesterase